MKTRFDGENKDFTDKAHEAAREQVYPHLFADDAVDIEIENVTRGQSREYDVLDKRLAVDVVIRATPPRFEQPIPVYVQERFRRPEYRQHQDITITKYNNSSGKASELSKIAAQQFVYGYYEPLLDEIQEAICVNTTILLRKIVDGELGTDENQNDKKQDFVTVTFDELIDAGATAFHLDRTASSASPVTVDQRQDITAYTGRGDAR